MNNLINETSPYLLQHARNPVDWFPWCDEAFIKAKKENKLALISIGYSACHWCHVMEHESFEDMGIAELMNRYFVCIKVDREERPDIDQYYLGAVQLISGTGGWPLNCFTLPDGKPVFGGTYFPKEKWRNALIYLAENFRNAPKRFYEAADSIAGARANITKEINSLSPKTNDTDKESEIAGYNGLLESWVSSMVTSFDMVNGGTSYVPKFPMPVVYEFLMYYAQHLKKSIGDRENYERITNQVYLTLDKMAMGGIHDQIGGGFSRYSTDGVWKAPHFEKMLYDNGQLMSLYSHGWQCNPSVLYKETVYGIHKFVSGELTSSDGAFYSALDADSDGQEGAFYVWEKEELEKLTGDDFPLFSAYYSISEKDVWEAGKYILFRKTDDETFCKKHGLEAELFRKKKDEWVKQLYVARQHRIAPGLDDKALASWNGIMLKGYTDSYKAFGEPEFLRMALKNAAFISEKFITPDGSMRRSYKNGITKISAFLDDYAFVADAFLGLYQCTFDEHWLNICRQLTEYALANFYDTDKCLFYYANKFQAGDSSKLVSIPRNIEVEDNVIPSSNSVMANLLLALGHTICREDFLLTSAKMMSVMKEYASVSLGYSNWAKLMLNLIGPLYEVVITGVSTAQFAKEINAMYIPNKIIAGAVKVSDMELLKEKFAGNETLIYVCKNKVCASPLNSSKEAIARMQNEF